MNYYNEIRKRITNVENYNRIKDYSKNKYTLENYYEIGKLLIDAQGGEKRAKYGDKIIEEYSKKLSREFKKGYSVRNLKYMRSFYLFEKRHSLCARLSWSHYRKLLSIKDNNEIDYYINEIIKYNISVRDLEKKIKSNEYGRLSNKAKELIKGPLNEFNPIDTYLKNPIMLPNKDNKSNISEEDLKNIILENLDIFLKELGIGYMYVGNEYKCMIGNTIHRIDILLYNIEYNSYVVVELKVNELKAEYIGQIKKYMEYIDNNLKKINQDKTIGIIIVNKDNKFITEYVSDKRIYKTTYVLK